MAESNFNDFQGKVDYTIKNLIDTNSYEKKKIYSSAPFLVLPQLKFAIKLGSLLPKFVCYVRQRGEQFGDAIAYNLANSSIKLFVYDKDNKLVIRDSMEITNANLGEITYTWKEFDLQYTGFYTAEIEIDSTTNGLLKLPSGQPRLEIIVT